MDLLKTIENTIDAHSMLSKGDRVLVALSGGADSAFLLRMLCKVREKYGISIGAAHVNHMLRDEADRDEEFSRRLCKDLGVEFHLKKVDIRRLSKDAKMGEEQYARDVRYSFFAELGYDKIATAHNKNDVAETLLFNFMRGASLKGLSGIPYKRDNIIRPILDIKKEDILKFSIDNGFKFVEDKTNFQAVYSRNKIRLELIPEIQREFNSNFVDVVTQNAKLIREDNSFLESMAEDAYQGEVTTDMMEKLAKPIFSRVCQLHYKKCTGAEDNLSSLYLDKISQLVKKNKTGKKLDLPLNTQARMEYGKLIFEKKTEQKSFEYAIEQGVVLKIPEIGKNILIKKTDGKGDLYLTDFEGLTVRTRRKGDIFYPSGMNGKKKLSDFFTDKKIPVSQRDQIPILCKGEDIVSVVGYRQDKRFMSGEIACKIEVEEYNAD